MAGAVTYSELRAKVTVENASQAGNDLAALKKHNDSLADSFKAGLGNLLGFASGFAVLDVAKQGLDLLVGAVKDVIDAGMQQQQVMAQTQAVIKSTGGAAHLSATQINDMADKLALMSGVSNDTIQGAENLLLTFKNIGEKTFPQATSAVLDMSVAMHEDMQTAAIQVGKALQDPINGVTTLRRVGVQLSDSQIELVKHLIATGNTAAAQAVIIKELNSEFGGSAEAAGKTLPGMLDRLNESWDQAKEKIAGAVIPILQDLVEKYVIPAADWFGAHLPAAIKVLTDFMNGTLIPTVNAFIQSPFVKTVEGWAVALANKLTPAVTGKNGIGPAATTAKGNVDELKTAFHLAGAEADDPNFKTHVKNAGDELTRFTGKLTGGDPKTAAVPALKEYSDELDRAKAHQLAANQTTSNSIPVLSGLGDAFGNLFGKIGQAKDQLGNFVDEIKTRFPDAEPAIQQILGNIGGLFETTVGGLHDLWDGFWGTITFPVKAGFHELEGSVTVGLDVLGGHFDKAQKDLAKTEDNIKNDFIDLGKSLLGILKGIFETIVGLPVDEFKALWKNTSKSLDDFKNAFSDWWTKTLLPDIEQAVYNFTHMIQDYINSHMPSFPGIGIPGFPGQARASGGPVSGQFMGAEQGPELLLTPGVYNAPPGSYVMNARDTAAALGGRGGMGGDTFYVTIVGTNKSAAQLYDEMQAEAAFRRRGHGG